MIILAANGAIGWIIAGIVLLLVLIALLLIALIRTLIFIPAKHSEFISKKDERRERIYAEKLSKMVQYETVSVKGVNQREKFLGFHKVLEELFPLVHKNLEKNEIDGKNDSVSFAGAYSFFIASMGRAC